MFSLLRACERGPDESAIEDREVSTCSHNSWAESIEAKPAPTEGEEAQPQQSAEEVIAGLTMEAATKALQMNFEEFYAVWDPKMGTPEVDVADLIMQVQKLNNKAATTPEAGAPEVKPPASTVEPPQSRKQESSEDDFLARFSAGEDNGGTAAAVAAAVAEAEREAMEAAEAADPEVLAFSWSYKERREEQQVWTVTLEKPAGSTAAGVRVRVPEGSFHALRIIEFMDGPFKAWNEAHPEQAIKLGDEIIEVNGRMGSGPMLLERIREDSTLRIALQRRSKQPPPPPKPSTPWTFGLPKCAKALVRR